MRARIAIGMIALTVVTLLNACAGPGPSPTGSDGPSASATASAEPTRSPSPSPSPTSTSKPVAIPTDCAAILSDEVLAQLGDTPLNPENFGPVGPQPDGSLICLWRDPRADTTGIRTAITYMNRGPALEMMNALVAEQGFTCYESQGGTRCEKEWPNEQYPVTDGRTLFWRGDVLIDTRYSNIAPSGFTASIVEHLFG